MPAEPYQFGVGGRQKGDVRRGLSEDNPGRSGAEFVGCDLDLWVYATGVTLDFSRPGEPIDDAFIEALNGRVCSECLNTHWFLTFADAAGKMEAWLRYYNEDRPHGAIGNKPPILLQNSGGMPSLPP